MKKSAIIGYLKSRNLSGEKHTPSTNIPLLSLPNSEQNFIYPRLSLSTILLPESLLLVLQNQFLSRIAIKTIITCTKRMITENLQGAEKSKVFS